MSSVKERIRQLELQSKSTPMKISRCVTPSSKMIEASPAALFSAVASPAPVESEVDTEFFEDAEEDRPGFNQRIVFLRHPPVPACNFLDFN